MLPTFKSFLLREVTVGRVDQFLKRQATVSYAHARHSRVVLSLMFNYALRHDAVVQNPIVGAAPLRQPKSYPKALTLDQIDRVRRAAAEWRTGRSVFGPSPSNSFRTELPQVSRSGRQGMTGAIFSCSSSGRQRRVW